MGDLFFLSRCVSFVLVAVWSAYWYSLLTRLAWVAQTCSVMHAENDNDCCRELDKWLDRRCGANEGHCRRDNDCEGDLLCMEGSCPWGGELKCCACPSGSTPPTVPHTRYAMSVTNTERAGSRKRMGLRCIGMCGERR